MSVDVDVSADDSIDELAVQAAVDGFPMKLRRAEQAEALRRMDGKYPNDVAAWLIGAPNTRMVQRVRSGVFR